MRDALVGLDVCGTNMKVALFSREGERLYMTVRKNVPLVATEGYYFDWEYQKRILFEMLKEVVEYGHTILSIGIGSCGEAVYPLDEKGTIIDNAIAWYCRRTEEQREEFAGKISDKDAYEICCLRSFYSYSAHKINWYKKYKPDVFKRTACWLPVDGFINYLLTGTKYCDYNQAGSSLLFDTRRRCWSDRLFQINGISKDTFPELIENGTMTGYLSEECKDLLGINYTIPVSIAGHDAWCGQFALGIGVSREAEQYVTSFTGTAGGVSLGRVIDKEELEELLVKEGIEYCISNYDWIIPYVYPGKYHCVYVGAVMDYYGRLVDSVMKLFYHKKTEEVTEADYVALQEEVDSSRPGANGVEIYVAEDDPKRTRGLRGMNILNLRDVNTRGDVFRAVMEYLCVADRRQLERIGERRERMRLVGGLAKNKSFVRIRAGILNMPQYIVEEEEVNALGAALLGGTGAGVYKSYEDAVSGVRMRYVEVVEPDPSLVKEYEGIYGSGLRSCGGI